MFSRKFVNLFDLSFGNSGVERIAKYLSKTYCYKYNISCSMDDKPPSGSCNEKMILLNTKIRKDINYKNYVKDSGLFISIRGNEEEVNNMDMEDLSKFNFVDPIKFLEDFNRIIIESRDGLLNDELTGIFDKQNNSSFGVVLSTFGIDITKDKFINIGVFKPYTIRENGYTFPTMDTDLGEQNIGMMDLAAIKHSCVKNCITHLALNNIHTIFKSFKFKVCVRYNDNMSYPVDCNTKYYYQTFKGCPLFNFNKVKRFSDLPEEVTDFLTFIEFYIGLKIIIISYGNDLYKTICTENIF